MDYFLRYPGHTDAPPWSAREIALMALPAEQERHTESRCVTLKAMCHPLAVCLSCSAKVMCHPLSVYLSCSARSAIEAISLALHSGASV